MLSKHWVTHKAHKGASIQPGDAPPGLEEAGRSGGGEGGGILGQVGIYRAGAPKLARQALPVWALSAAWESPLRPRIWGGTSPKCSPTASPSLCWGKGQELLSAHWVPGTDLKSYVLGPIKYSQNNRVEVSFFLF